MNKIGDVQRIFSLHEDWIVSISISSKNELHIKNGDLIRFGKCGEVVVSGLKYWPDRSALDVLIKKEERVPQPGEIVYIVN
ncbi:hypothetical protein SAMN05216386_0107 [Nitrosospira briensis]|uniref:Uncharacterized protein n=1 Tax=Nitrosospira briensis TaxID=35799 RepID=A0A1I4XFT6_9PROT|nr:hypothetical protein [Nitrosospira briensis]SFN24781.1 hypothetical protein SAMN05216386_0107 [Nitrosospira briensis]